MNAHTPITTTDTATPISLTENAARRIAELVAEDGAAVGLRVSVEGGGCTGFQYQFDLARAIEADDLTIARNGALVVIDAVSVDYMAGSEIDFVEDLIGSAFKIKNPLATAACGCGTSFTI